MAPATNSVLLSVCAPARLASKTSLGHGNDGNDGNVKPPRRWRREAIVRRRFGAVHWAIIRAQFDACAAELARFADLIDTTLGFE